MLVLIWGPLFVLISHGGDMTHQIMIWTLNANWAIRNSLLFCYGGYVFKTKIDKKLFIISPLPVEMIWYIYQINWTNKPINSWLLIQNQVNPLSESESEPEIVYSVHWYICSEATLIANTCIVLQKHCRSRCIEIFQWNLIHVHKLPRDNFTLFV